MPCDKKIENLRRIMKNECIETYIITKSDPHQSEYAEPHWNGVEFISGFTGSAGTVVVTETHAGLWTDGRYYIQAEKELFEGFTLHRAAELNAVGVLDYAVNETKDGGTIGFDGRTFSYAQVKTINEKIKSKNILLKTENDLLYGLWDDRPPLRNEKIRVHEIKYCGEPAGDKIRKVREKLTENGGAYILSSLDDIAWLTNLRGADIPANRLFAAYMVIENASAVLFVNPEKMPDAIPNGYTVKPYGEFYDYIKKIDKKITICPGRTPYNLYAAVSKNEINEIGADYTTILKSVKNETEIRNLKNANIKDGAALTGFIKWVKENAGEITEHDAVIKLREFRARGEGFVRESFPTIAAYMENAAIVHYGTKKESAAQIKPNGFLLVDSGGQYDDGTTDITRTISLGGLSDEMKKNYTIVLKGHIGLAMTIFPYGVSGSRLDPIARAPLWKSGLDYNHGTGHGIGFCLSVHEGPQSISSRNNEIKLEEGMIISNEPGLYLIGRYGIRHENTVLVKNHSETEHGRFLCLETISFAPFCTDAIEEALLTEPELEWLNDYHAMVYETLSPLLDEPEREWLKYETRKIRKGI